MMEIIIDITFFALVFLILYLYDRSEQKGKVKFSDRIKDDDLKKNSCK